ncbi:hypothetical protein N5K21_07390 [Rhizobium pusense]|uniref:Uncharacterized protein n=1 Tax=Agrobacterium pusense TaxID=648995 RepID=A0A6H0ZRU3_9HYPH|nr:hypothetical protein [Agrobacterium pusense]MDH2088544.1 hypothetical protein [Agrobacterium pusense]QIX22581.1 hypothetical protein FOB41_16245 [Agrobacterium pusense]WCK24490.1 hypothetical protein CFBP5496_0002535 [Agrobacterium pusense]
MTALKLFSIAANGTHMGIFKAIDEHAAVLAYAQDAGYKTIADAAYIHSEYELGEKAADELDQIIADWRAELDVEEVTTGSVVAFSKAADATWFEVIRTHGDHGLEVREVGSEYQTQLLDRCYVAQIKAA